MARNTNNLIATETDYTSLFESNAFVEAVGDSVESTLKGGIIEEAVKEEVSEFDFSDAINDALGDYDFSDDIEREISKTDFAERLESLERTVGNVRSWMDEDATIELNNKVELLHQAVGNLMNDDGERQKSMDNLIEELARVSERGDQHNKDIEILHRMITKRDEIIVSQREDWLAIKRKLESKPKKNQAISIIGIILGIWIGQAILVVAKMGPNNQNRAASK